MKTVAAATADVARRLARTWSPAVVAEVAGGVTETPWPHVFPLGQANGTTLAQTFSDVMNAVADWNAFEQACGVHLDRRIRRVQGTDQTLPTHLHVPDVDTAAAIAGDGWLGKLEIARERAQRLHDRFPDALDERVLSAVSALSAVDFDVLLRAGEWFRDNDATGYTPRQVPVEGVHAKWLNGHHALVARLAGVDQLPLLPRHPARIHLTYLDPAHLDAGGRRYDCLTVADAAAPAYEPHVVLISENKDTAVHFPRVPAGVAIEGFGRGGATAASFEWLRSAPHVIYWGDMDVDGLEILDGFRAAGVPATSILMDVAAYDTWQRYGTNADTKGRELAPRPARAVPHLTGPELELYARLSDPAWRGHRRIEQERIPLAVALAEVERVRSSYSVRT